MEPPPVTVAGATLSIERSASRLGVTVDVALLLVRTGSVSVAAPTDAVLAIGSTAVATTATVTVMSGWAATSAPLRVQVTVPLLCEQVQPPPLAALKVRPLGSVSVTVMVPVAVDGPALVTVSL